jgi:hypothetical protein
MNTTTQLHQELVTNLRKHIETHGQNPSGDEGNARTAMLRKIGGLGDKLQQQRRIVNRRKLASKINATN